MYDILEVILILKEKRDKLNLYREVNLVKINECERLIQYYCMLYNRTLGSINKKRQSLDMYDELLDIKEMIRSPKWMEAIVPLSNKYISKKQSSLSSKIDSLMEKGNNLKDNVELYQRKKLVLESETLEIEKQLDYIEDELRHTNEGNLNNSYVKKLVLKG